MVKIEIERMGKGHALSACLSWKLLPGELEQLRDNPEALQTLARQLAIAAQRDLTSQLPAHIKRGTIK